MGHQPHTNQSKITSDKVSTFIAVMPLIRHESSPTILYRDYDWKCDIFNEIQYSCELKHHKYCGRNATTPARAETARVILTKKHPGEISMKEKKTFFLYACIMKLCV